MSEKKKIQRNRRRVYQDSPLDETVIDSSAVVDPAISEHDVCTINQKSGQEYNLKEYECGLLKAVPSPELPQSTEASATALEDSSELVVPPPENLKPFDRAAFPEEADQFGAALKIVRRWSAVSVGVGLVPIPLVDMAGLMMIQLQMLRSLSRLYQVSFDSERSKTAIAVLASGINTMYLSATAFKLVPVFGLLSYSAIPAANAAITYAVGRVFIQHFASGGTFLNFEPSRVRKYFEHQYREGRLRV